MEAQLVSRRLTDPRVLLRLPTPQPNLPKLTTAAAIGRWSGIGPYYAMFPVQFAFEIVARYSLPGDAILDPFAGRASSIYAAVAQERTGYGIEIHPVGWLYGRVKLAPATECWVQNRIRQIGEIADSVTDREIADLPTFFHVCYCKAVLKYLIAARENLLWETSRVDATLMAIILVNLHGKRSQCLSNQMRQGKAMDPNYSVRWWKKRNMLPPEINPERFLQARVTWRYTHGAPKLSHGHIERGDSTLVLNRLASRRLAAGLRPFDLLFTSPPYYGVTNYFYDQWLRLWMLGGSEIPTSSGEQWEGKFNSKTAYQQLLQRVFKEAAKCMNPQAVIYVRTDAREFTFKTTLEALKEAFPNKCLEMVNRPFKRATQTALYGDKSKKPGEVDIILQ